MSGVDEGAVATSSIEDLVTTLARMKAKAVAAQVADNGHRDAVVVGCDSMLSFGGESLGKPATADEARDRWRRMRGNSGTLLTGHCVVDLAAGATAEAFAATTVRFGCPSDDEIDAYVATGEPLHVAGAFTLDGRSAAFIDGVDGDPSNVIGLSLPLFRSLLQELGIAVPELWA